MDVTGYYSTFSRFSDFFYCGKVYLKFTILSILNCTVQGIEYTHIVQPSLPFLFRTFSLSQTEILYPLNNNSPLPPTPAPDNHHSTCGRYDFDDSRYFI